MELPTDEDGSLADKWNIVVCGDFSPEPFIVLVSNPKKWKITHIKKKIEDEAKVPARNLNLYLNDRILPDDRTVYECDGMENGVAIYAAMKPVVITVYRAGAGVSAEIKMPRNEFPHWTVVNLIEIACFKFLLNPKSSHVLASQGIKLERNEKLSTYVSDNGVITLTSLKHFKMIAPPLVDAPITALPALCSLPLASRNVFYSRELRPVSNERTGIASSPSLGLGNLSLGSMGTGIASSPSLGLGNLSLGSMGTGIASSPVGLSGSVGGIHTYTHGIGRPTSSNTPIWYSFPQWVGKWSVVLQRLSGARNILTVDSQSPQSTTVHFLRELVETKLSIPTYQQKLVVGDIILEDWDEQGNVMLLANYPKIHDGATMYVAQLTEGIKVMHNLVANNVRVQAKVSGNSAIDLPPEVDIYPSQCLSLVKPSTATCTKNYINIPSTQEFSIEKLYKILENFSKSNLKELFVGRVQIVRSTAMLNTFKSTVVHECTISSQRTLPPPPVVSGFGFGFGSGQIDMSSL